LPDVDGTEPPPWLAALHVGRLLALAAAPTHPAGGASPGAAGEPPRDADAFRRTVANAPAPHYLGAMLAGDGTGHGAVLRRWTARAEPIRVWVQAAPPALDSLAGMRAQVGELFERWNALALGVRFAPEADSSRAEVHVTWAEALGTPRAPGAPTAQTGSTLLLTDERGRAVAATWPWPPDSTARPSRTRPCTRRGTCSASATRPTRTT
jgi:hypothetical protein